MGLFAILGLGCWLKISLCVGVTGKDSAKEMGEELVNAFDCFIIPFSSKIKFPKNVKIKVIEQEFSLPEDYKPTKEEIVKGEVYTKSLLMTNDDNVRRAMEEGTYPAELFNQQAQHQLVKKMKVYEKTISLNYEIINGISMVQSKKGFTKVDDKRVLTVALKPKENISIDDLIKNIIYLGNFSIDINNRLGLNSVYIKSINKVNNKIQVFEMQNIMSMVYDLEDRIKFYNERGSELDSYLFNYSLKKLIDANLNFDTKETLQEAKDLISNLS